MNKVLLIIQREYLTRVRKKAFIVMTLLVPGLLAGMFFVIKLIAENQSQQVHKVYVFDESGLYRKDLHDSKTLKYRDTSITFSQAQKSLKNHEDDLLLHIPAKITAQDSILVLAAKKNNLGVADNVQQDLITIATNNSMVKEQIDTAKLHRIKPDIKIQAREYTEAGIKNGSIGSAYALAFAGAILIYMSLFIYGAQVMRGVIEEKTSRIIEVIVSSVKPFQLMTGKIIGVGLVGLTQFALWITLSVVVTKVIGANTPQQGAVMIFIHNLGENAGYQLFCFIFYWLTGFLLYSALFAAVGSAVDSETETQQFMFPITLPLLFTYILSVSYLFQAPDSPLAVWLSMIPFTAPVAMMIRVPFHPPMWQLAISMVLMIVGFLFTTYVASRIYRVGILMYGKKASFAEMKKWFFYKE